MTVKQRRMEKYERKRIAVEQISKMFEEARTITQEKANVYVHKARMMAQRANIRIPREIKRRYCKHCYTYLRPGRNYRVRTRNGYLVIYCYTCKKCTKQGLGKKKDTGRKK